MRMMPVSKTAKSKDKEPKCKRSQHVFGAVPGMVGYVKCYHCTYVKQGQPTGNLVSLKDIENRQEQ